MDNKEIITDKVRDTRSMFTLLVKNLKRTGIQVFNAIDAESFPIVRGGARVNRRCTSAREWPETDEVVNPLTPEALSDTVEKLTCMASYMQMQPVTCALFLIMMSIQVSDDQLVRVWDVKKFLVADRVDIHPFKKELDWLEKNGYIKSTYSMRDDGYMCCDHIVNALLNNKSFEKPEPMVLDRYKFCQIINKFIDRGIHNASATSELLEDMKNLEEKYRELKMVDEITSILSTDVDRLLFYKLCDLTARYSIISIAIEGLALDIFSNGSERYRYVNSFLDGDNPLLKKGLVEIKSVGMANDTHIALSAKGKEILFENDMRAARKRGSSVASVIKAADIGDVRLFFEGELSSNVCELHRALEEDNFISLQNRLAENSLPKGVTAVFYGAPGTGKTELARQIARETGRTIMQVDISRIKSCWVGESEKLIKEVFTDYQALCADETLKPILLFNEADAILTSRQDPSASNNSSVVQMMNTMQNIILEEMERLNGILIATTNLHTNLDPAFERRFLYKIRFEKPDKSVRKSIWRSKMPRLTEEEAEALSLRHNFSGGEIDNIVRKTLINEILSGEKSCLERIESYCKSERFSKDGVAKVGF